MLEDGGKFGKNYDVPDDVLEEFSKQYNPTPPAELARHALQKVAKNKPVIVTPPSWNVFWWIYRLFPGVVLRIGRKRFADVKARMEERGINVYG